MWRDFARSCEVAISPRRERNPGRCDCPRLTRIMDVKRVVAMEQEEEVMEEEDEVMEVAMVEEVEELEELEVVEEEVQGV